MAGGNQSDVTSDSASSAAKSTLLSTPDLGHTLQITQHKLNGLNFREWYQSVLLVIRGKGKVGYLTGETCQPKQGDSGYQQWEAENSIIMALLINFMEARIGRTFLFYSSAHEIWKGVQDMYSDLENTSQCFEIRSILRSTRQGTMTVTEYYNRLVDLWHNMDLFYSIPWKCSDDGNTYNQMLEKDRVFDFLQGLNKDLDEVRGRILGVKPLPSLREVFSEVRREKSQRRVMLTSNEGIFPEEQPQGSALMSSHSQNHKANKDVDHLCENCKKPFPYEGNLLENTWKTKGLEVTKSA